MATEAQINANRLSAQHSTGPVTAQGKAAVRFNALKHGADAASMYIPGEDPAEREALSESLVQTFQPQNEDEAFQVETLVDLQWNIRRLAASENRMLNLAVEGAADPQHRLAEIYLEGGPQAKALDRVFRKKQALRREYFKVRKELLAARKQRAAESPKPVTVLPNRLCSATSEPQAPPPAKPASEATPAASVRPFTGPPR